MKQKIYTEDWGLLHFAEAWDKQTQIHQALVAHKLAHRSEPAGSYPQDHRLVFVEHPPVYTLGKSGKADHLLLSETECAARGIDYFPINRGGDITFHGPGQLVVYPLLDLECFFSDVHRYVRNLEEVVIRTLADEGLAGTRIKDYTGVWISDFGFGISDLQIPNPKSQISNRKLCAIGVHLSRWVTLHGLALNVHTDLQYFDYIIPCGIQDEDKTVTSMARELNRAIDMHGVKQRMMHHFAEVFQCAVEPARKNGI
ncbi:MAG: lipoyl(octanoyl) transferase LipB [Saprospiraceae bacterium]